MRASRRYERLQGRWRTADASSRRLAVLSARARLARLTARAGKIPRGAHLELKPPEHRKAGSFSKTFSSGPYKFSGLNTTTTKSFVES